MNKEIYLSNSLGNKKEIFEPLDKKNVGMYVCGPTVYDDPHIGNARPIVIFDLLFKVLKCKFGKETVTYVRNITDIDDKIINAAKEKNISITELTEKTTKTFHDDCKYLNCEKPTHEPKATENIELMIKMIEDLINKKFAYESEKHVYFKVKNFKDIHKTSFFMVDFSDKVKISENEIRFFLKTKMYNNKEVLSKNNKGKSIIKNKS